MLNTNITYLNIPNSIHNNPNNTAQTDTFRCDIVVWNCNSYTNKLDELKIIVKKYNPKVICLQETRLNNDNELKFRGFRSVVKSRIGTNLNASGGVAILVKNGYDFEDITIPDDIEAIALKVYLEKTINICCMYIPPDHQTTVGQLKKIKDHIPLPCIMAGDLNAHNYLWGSDHICPRGKIVEEFLDSTELLVNNTGKMTRIPMNRNHKQSAIDLCLSDPLTSRYLDWDVADETYRSDHLPMIINCLPKNVPYLKRSMFKLDKADWKEYGELADLSNIDLNQSNTQINDEMISVLNKAAMLTIPVTKSNRILPVVPWWDDQIKLVVKSRKKALDVFKSSPTQVNHSAYLIARHKSRLLIQEKKSETWEKYVSKISPATNSKEVWDRIRKIEGRNPKNSFTGIRTAYGTESNPKKVANLLGQSFSSISSTAEYSNDFIELKQIAERKEITSSINFANIDIDGEFSFLELKMALSTAKGKSPGPNNIPYPLFKNLTFSNKHILLKMFNKIWFDGKMPDQWRSALVIPLVKNSQKPSTCDNSRPIALENCDEKLMEKVVNNRLVWYLEEHNLISPNQSGFRKGKSTMHNLTIFENDIRESFKNNRHLDAVFFDLRKAYDKLWRYSILKQLSLWNIGGKVFNFIKDFLYNRTFRVLVGNVESDEFPLENGVPQGSVLSVTLFLIGINGMADIIAAHKNVKFLMYADDILIYRSGTNSTGNQTALQKCINGINKHAKANGFQFSVEKTKGIHFCKKHVCLEPYLEFDGVEIDFSNTIKFLGMIFDSKLSWRRHILEIKNKCKSRMNVIKVLSNIHWGANRDQLLRMVQCLILSVLDYGCHLYGAARTSNLKPLDPLLNGGLRCATGAFRTSPVLSILCESGFMDLSMQRELKSLLFYFKLREDQNSLLYKSLINSRNYFSKIAMDISNSLEIEFSVIKKLKICLNPANFDHIVIDKRIYIFTRKEKSNKEVCLEFKNIEEEYNGWNFLYTDGSKHAHQSGYAMINKSQNDIHMFQTNQHESIYSIELKAILHACLIASRIDNQNFVVATDSWSSLEAIDNPLNKHPIVQNIKSTILTSTNKIILLWVPAHVGIKGNEMADKYANLALEAPEKDDHVTYDDIQVYVKNKFHSMNNLQWMAKIGHLRMIKCGTGRSIYGAELTRREAVVLARLRIGHTNLTHQHYMSKEAPPICPFCQLNLNIKHILVDCTNIQNLRVKYKLSSDIATMLTYDPIETKNLFSFLRESDFLNKI